MQIDTLAARFGLAPHCTLRLRDARGVTLLPVRGTLWITIDNDPRDIVLEVGECFTVDVDQPVIVTALGACAEFDARGRRTSGAAPHRSTPRSGWRAVVSQMRPHWAWRLRHAQPIAA